MTTLHELSIAEAGRLIRRGELSAAQLAAHALERIRRLNPVLHAFVRVTTGRALAEAAQADLELSRGIDRGALHGMPYALKDIYDVAGLPTSCCSHLMADHVAQEDSTVVRRLREAGAVLLGKLATHEFALGGPSTDLPFPPARNPWSPDHFCGGSSSGAAVAVAAGMTRIALGSDTSGSIRGPAFYCSTIGLKPSFGLVSRKGVFPLSYSLDHCGPLTWTVEDAADVLQAIAGFDPQDLSSEDLPPAAYRTALDRGVEGLSIGYPRHFWTDGGEAAPELVAALDGVAQVFTELGARVEEVVIPDFELFSACGRVIMTAEGYAIHEQMLRERPSAFGRYTYQRLVPGAGLTAADLVQAHRLRLELARTLDGGVLARHHALLVAVGLSAAGRVADFPRDWSPRMSMRTIPFTVTGHPAMAVPCGFTPQGLPLGFQIVGRAFDEATVLRIGAAYQRAMGHPSRRPPMASVPQATACGSA